MNAHERIAKVISDHATLAQQYDDLLVAMRNSKDKTRRTLEWGNLHQLVTAMDAIAPLVRIINAVIKENWSAGALSFAADRVDSVAAEYTMRLVSVRRVSRSTSTASNVLEDYRMESFSFWVADELTGSKLTKLAAALRELATVEG